MSLAKFLKEFGKNLGLLILWVSGCALWLLTIFIHPMVPFVILILLTVGMVSWQDVAHETKWGHDDRDD